MLFDDSYKEPQTPATSRLNIRGSKFYGFLFPVKSENEIKAHLEQIKQQYPDATHWCYAYILNIDKSNQRFNDDGEPANTAGRPILRQIQSLDLTNTLIVVVRYFGGKLLGVPGLIEAYGETAKLVLQSTPLIEKAIEFYYSISFDFVDEALVWQLAKQYNARVHEKNYDSKGNFTLAVPKKNIHIFEETAKNMHKLEWRFLKPE
ncbi:MAG: IMPACT family protein [Bacteroidia bacterium]|nr:IMPACT family protein [Bacteroidia bacterium]